MLGYVHLLPETRPALERRTVAGTALWVLEGDLDGGLLPRRRLRRWTRRLAECGVSHAALPPGREAEFAPIRPVLPDGLRLALLPRLLDCLAPAGDTALLLADRADSRTLCAARVLAERFRHLRLSVGPGQEALERQLLRQLGLTTGGGAISGGTGRALLRRSRCWRLCIGRGGCRMWVSNPRKRLTSAHKITIMQRDIL